MTKVIHVHLIYEKKNLYFGSISAIFENLTEKQVGITKSSLLHAGLTDGAVKYTKRAMIIQSHLICASSNWPNCTARSSCGVMPSPKHVAKRGKRRNMDRP